MCLRMRHHKTLHFDGFYAKTKKNTVIEDKQFATLNYPNFSFTHKIYITIPQKEHNNRRAHPLLLRPVKFIIKKN